MNPILLQIIILLAATLPAHFYKSQQRNNPFLSKPFNTSFGRPAVTRTQSNDLPCVSRLNQVYCQSPGHQYPSDKIKTFIDDNKALIRRMFGSNYQNVMTREADLYQSFARGRSSSSSWRHKRDNSEFLDSREKTSSEYEDSCESTIERNTPYWASNSAGQVRAIVNTELFPQAVHQEICRFNSTSSCGGKCRCEQKLAYHRLLAYDPKDDCKGIFIDWFLFPSCCACRCRK